MKLPRHHLDESWCSQFSPLFGFLLLSSFIKHFLHLQFPFLQYPNCCWNLEDIGVSIQCFFSQLPFFTCFLQSLYFWRYCRNCKINGQMCSLQISPLSDHFQSKSRLRTFYILESYLLPHYCRTQHFQSIHVQNLQPGFTVVRAPAHLFSQRGANVLT